MVGLSCVAVCRVEAMTGGGDGVTRGRESWGQGRGGGWSEEGLVCVGRNLYHECLRMGEAWVHLAAETEPNVRDSEMLGTLAQALHPERTWCWLFRE